MKPPVACARAAALRNHAAYLGVRPSEFALLLSVAEAFELIDWLLSDDGPRHLNRDVLAYDVQIARATGNPWAVLENFELDGFAIRRRPDFAEQNVGVVH